VILCKFNFLFFICVRKKFPFLGLVVFLEKD
jgi:hypothetical protein